MRPQTTLRPRYSIVQDTHHRWSATRLLFIVSLNLQPRAFRARRDHKLGVLVIS